MKKKLTAVALIVCMLAIMLVGASLAYFNDSKAVKNTFTAGKVNITLTETKTNAAGEPIDKDNKTKEEAGDSFVAAKIEGGKLTDNNQPGNSYKLYPGMTVTKDPTITLVEGSEEAYIAAKITVKDAENKGSNTKSLWDLYGVWEDGKGEKYWNIDITEFVSGGLIQKNSEQKFNWNGLSMIYTDNSGNVYYQEAKDGEWVMYTFIKAIKQDSTSIKLFETIEVDADYGNAEMAALNGATVKVEAFAVQAYGFTTSADDATDCFTAMKKAFPEQFNIGTAATTSAE